SKYPCAEPSSARASKSPFIFGSIAFFGLFFPAGMGWPISSVFILALALLPCHADKKYNVSFADLHNCKQHNAVSGYNYRAFYKLHALDHHRPNETDTVVDLLLYVMASRDGHILLTEEPKVTSVALEIVLGGGSNSFSQIRLGQKGNPLKTKSSPGLLSPIDALPLRVQIAVNGQIKVYAGNLTSEPFMETMLPSRNATTLQYVSFTTWGTALATWFYDCPAPITANTTNDRAIDGNELELLIDGKDRLKQDFLSAPLQIDPPENFTGVLLSQLYVRGFRYDQTSSLVELSGSMRLYWKDPRYSWNASDYNQTHGLGDVCHAIWMPSFEPMTMFSGDFSDCVVLDDGRVMVVIEEFSWVDFCAVADSYRWPYDRNTCLLRLTATGYERTVPLRLANQTVVYEGEFEQSEWSLKQLVKHETDRSDTPNGLLPALELYLVMDRKSDIHSSSIYPTYFVANLLIYISFLVDGRSRLLLNSLGLIVLLNTFLSMSVVVPGGEIPKIYVFFQWSLIFYSISSILFVVDLWLKRSRATLAPGSWLNRVISYPALRYALAMDQRSNYNTLEYKNVRWDEVTCVLNRIMMVVVVVTFCVGFTKP
uniref:Neurotransmitter-gated ion-channel ligand-binding domain-containing protein n=2 Tax=Anopheles atroparvus TaxID=41427 RepID=A0A182JN83_ANOAO